mgnify:CR=1 FL=1
MKTVVVWLLVAVSDGSYNYGTVTVIAEYENQQVCEQTAEKRPERFKASWYLDCIELIKEVKE